MIKASIRAQFILGLFILLVLYFSSMKDVQAKEVKSIGGDFTLIDHNGTKFELEQLRGKLVLMFFGYTFCPDICPTELSVLSQVLKSLDEDVDKVASLFITIDPERDTPKKLKQYVSYFNPHLTGLTGSLEEVNKVADAYNVLRKIQEHDKSDQYYSVDHSASLYLIGIDGKLIQIIPYGLPGEHILEAIQHELKKFDSSN